MRHRRSHIAAIFSGLILLGWIGWSFVALHRADEARDTARAQASAAGTVALPGRSFAARDGRAAHAALSAWLGDKATATATRLSLIPLASAFPGQVRLKLAARADEASLRRFARAVEQSGLLQIGRWTIASAGDGNITLSAEVAANWRKDAQPLPAVPLAPAETGRTLFASVATPDAAPISGDMPELVGIAGRIPDDAVAMLRLASGTTRALGRGAVADGWRITAIAADRVTLVKDGRVHVAVLPPTSR
jgi:hypothetical protein